MATNTPGRGASMNYEQWHGGTLTSADTFTDITFIRAQS